MKTRQTKERRLHAVSARALLASVLSTSVGCTVGQTPEPYVPSLRYNTRQADRPALHGAAMQREESPHARLRFVERTRPEYGDHPRQASAQPELRLVGADAADLESRGVHVERSGNRARPYAGPLELGDPGVTSSLWRESRAGNEVFRDFRAWQPMDLLTIVVTERSRGMHDADTEVKSTSQVLAAIQNFLGLEEQTEQWNHPPNLSSLVRAQTQNNYKGEGLTNRQAELTARISAVVAEVLPSGLLRIEGEKIISVNNEEQVMVISGLVRQRDINSLNEIDSSKVAQMRIDYYGKGTVGEAQRGGWIARLMRYVWPF